MAYTNKEEHIFKVGDIASADSDYQVSIPSAFYMTLSELEYEDVEDLDGELAKVWERYFKDDNELSTSLATNEIYVITKNIKITYEY